MCKSGDRKDRDHQDDPHPLVLIQSDADIDLWSNRNYGVTVFKANGKVVIQRRHGFWPEVAPPYQVCFMKKDEDLQFLLHHLEDFLMEQLL